MIGCKLTQCAAVLFSSVASLMGAVPDAWGADHWSRFNEPPMSPVSSLTGNLHGMSVAISNVDLNFYMVHLGNGIAWGNSNAGIYPQSVDTSIYQFVRRINTPVTIAAPSMAHIDFSRPVVDPILVFYSLDRSGLTVKGTTTTNGDAPVVSIQSNYPTQIDAATLSVSGPFGGGVYDNEGCNINSSRVCGIYRFTGTYSRLSIGQFGDAGDGTGFQIGLSITPAAATDTYSGTIGAAVTAIPDVRVNDNFTGAAGTAFVADATNSTLAPQGTWPSGITLNPTTGAVEIASDAKAGNYALSYTLCDAHDSTNCAAGKVTINLAARPLTPVPTLHGWGLALLAALAGVFGLRARRNA